MAKIFSLFDQIQVKLGIALTLLCGAIVILVVQFAFSLHEKEHLLAWTNIAGSRRMDTQLMVNLASEMVESGERESESKRLGLIEKIHDMESNLERLEGLSIILNHSDEVVMERLTRVQNSWRDQFRPSLIALSRDSAKDPPREGLDRIKLDASTFILGLNSLIEANELLASRRGEQTMAWMIALVLAAVGAVVLLLGLGWSISNRIAELARVARDFQEGRVESLSRWSSSKNDEVTSLGQAFQAMALHLQIMNETSERERLRVQTIMDTVWDALITIDHKGTVLTANSSVEKLLGYRKEEIIGKNVSMLTPSPHRENHDSYLARYMSTGHAKVVGIEREVEGMHKNGSLVPVALRVSRMETESGTQFVGLLQDISDRVQARRTQENLGRSISEAATSVGIASRRIVEAISDQSRNSQNQAASIAETVAAAEEVTQISSQSAANANSVADVAHRADNLGKSGRSSVKQTLGMMASVKMHSDKIGLSVRALAQQANAIGEIIASVNDVAEQTNLLALNAAIEASRAGEHGRGFSVVAGEVKALAQQSKKATAQVRQILGEVQNATIAAVSASEEGSREVHSAMTVAEETGVTIDELAAALSQAAEVAEQISCSTSQGATGMSQINDAMKNINHAVESSMRAIHDVQTAANDLEAVGERLQELTKAS